jgi:50S ribosomal protein L16 3-hydroxylase
MNGCWNRATSSTCRQAWRTTAWRSDGDCMTYSIGFRAPSRSELIGDCGLRRDPGRAVDDDRYADPGLSPPGQPRRDHRRGAGPVAGDGGRRPARPHALCPLVRPPQPARRKYPDVDWRPEEPLSPAAMRAALARGAALERNPASRFAFVAGRGRGGDLLFVDGHVHRPVPVDAAAFARLLCAQPVEARSVRCAACGSVDGLITALCNQGSLAFADED